MVTPGADVLLEIEKPAAGGRMIARLDGQVVLVAGAIPGERVRARVERAERSVAYATVVDVVEPSADRRPVAADPACGGAAFAHVAYPRQIDLKREIVLDAFRRIGKLTLDAALAVEPSPERGYRMRARLHVREGLIGFFREGTHELCDPGGTGQLLDATVEALGGVARELAAVGAGPVLSIELGENVSGDERALHLDLKPAGGPPPAVYAGLARVAGVTGVTGQAPPADVVSLGGRPWVGDAVETLVGRPPGSLGGPRLLRRAQAFFQANRFLLPTLVSRVVGRVGEGRVTDLYAGVGVFAVSLAALGWPAVTAVEGDRTTGADLVENARPFPGLHVVRAPVESFLGNGGAGPDETLLVDPPRTGMSREAMAGVIARGARRVVYVSCDVATLARDVRRLVDAGYTLAHAEAFDLFPTTAHVETLVVLERS